MSKHARTSSISAVLRSMQLEEYLNRNRTYVCVRCSKASVREVVVDASALRIIDTDAVPRVVAYKVKCKNRTKPILYDRVGTCFTGDETIERSEATCNNCKYAEAVTVKVKPIQVNQYRVTCNCYRIVYRCTNPKRMEQFSKDTYMASYITCEHHEER